MRRFKKSLVAWSGAGALASFAVLYKLMPYDRLLDLALSLAFGISLAVVARYFMDAMRAIRSGRGGADFLIFCIFSIAFMILLQRAWVILLTVYNRPDWLSHSPMTIFIPWMLSWAVSLALFAPDVDNVATEGVGVLAKSIALFVSGALAGFVHATSFKIQDVELSSAERVWPHLMNRASCPDDQPVWGSGNKVYHIHDSPYRGMVIPDWCFSSASEAEDNGFRAPKGVAAD